MPPMMLRSLHQLAGAVLALGLMTQGLPALAQPQPPPPKPNSLGADWRLQQEEARERMKARQIMPLGRVIEVIRARQPGRELDAGLEYQGPRAIYRVRWMTPNGRRIDYLVDAATGAILSGG
jgi:uncharacterized membrane protein YkoI